MYSYLDCICNDECVWRYDMTWWHDWLTWHDDIDIDRVVRIAKGETIRWDLDLDWVVD